MLTAFKVVHVRWRSRKMLQLILNNGSLINTVLAGHSGDIEKLLIDKSLVGKLSAETVSDGMTLAGFQVGPTFPYFLIFAPTFPYILV